MNEHLISMVQLKKWKKMEDQTLFLNQIEKGCYFTTIRRFLHMGKYILHQPTFLTKKQSVLRRKQG